MRDIDDDLEGFTQEERAQFAELTRIEHDKVAPALPGRVELLGLLRRRDGAAYFEGLPSAFVARLHDGHVAWGIPDLAQLDDHELAQFSVHASMISARIAAELLKRAVDRG